MVAEKCKHALILQTFYAPPANKKCAKQSKYILQGYHIGILSLPIMRVGKKTITSEVAMGDSGRQNQVRKMKTIVSLHLFLSTVSTSKKTTCPFISDIVCFYGLLMVIICYCYHMLSVCYQFFMVSFTFSFTVPLRLAKWLGSKGPKNAKSGPTLLVVVDRFFLRRDGLEFVAGSPCFSRGWNIWCFPTRELLQNG